MKLSATQWAQLAWYVKQAEEAGCYYGNKAQFDKRHDAIKKAVDKAAKESRK